MKTLVLGDIHGRLIWSDILTKEQPNKIIFLGDYVSSHDNISGEQQLVNLEDILNLKEFRPNDVVLLRGNHDLQHMGYYWASCSGLNRTVLNNFPKGRFEKLSQWIYIQDNILFSHAGISQVWLDNCHIKVEEINNMPIDEHFAFTPDNRYDYCGESKTQPPTWIRPWILMECKAKGNWTQVIGHTSVKKCQIVPEDKNIWLCDALGSGSYLIIEDRFEAREL